MWSVRDLLGACSVGAGNTCGAFSLLLVSAGNAGHVEPEGFLNCAGLAWAFVQVLEDVGICAIVQLEDNTRCIRLDPSFLSFTIWR